MKQGDLAKCPICHGLEIDDEFAFLDDMKCAVKAYTKGKVVVNQGDLVDSLYILILGSVKTEMFTEDGNVVNIENIKAPRPLAPAFLFSDKNRFPVTVTALEETEVIKIPKEEIIRLMQTNPNFMQNYLMHNSNRTQFLSNRLQLLSIKTIKGKLAHFILEHTRTVNETIELEYNQSELADYFGVARPSLARSISEMEEDGLISVQRKTYTILNINKLKELL